MGTHNICLYKEVDKKYSGCNLKTTYSGMCGNWVAYGVIFIQTKILKQETLFEIDIG